MQELKKEEMLQIDGGSTIGTIGIGLLIGAGITFVIGVIDGIVNPSKC